MKMNIEWINKEKALTEYNLTKQEFNKLCLNYGRKKFGFDWLVEKGHVDNYIKQTKIFKQHAVGHDNG